MINPVISSCAKCVSEDQISTNMHFMNEAQCLDPPLPSHEKTVIIPSGWQEHRVWEWKRNRFEMDYTSWPGPTGPDHFLICSVSPACYLRSKQPPLQCRAHLLGVWSGERLTRVLWRGTVAPPCLCWAYLTVSPVLYTTWGVSSSSTAGQLTFAN